MRIHFVTHEPSFLQKLLQVYWVNPKSWLLKELLVEDGNISITVMNGKSIKAPIKDCIFKYQFDKYDRMEIYVYFNEDKIHFKEMLGMLKSEEWQEIRSFIKKECKAKKTGLGIISDILSPVTGIGKSLT